MYINKIILKGYRNFKNATINLSSKSLIIGSNDVGKSNLLRAIRLLLDKSFSLIDLDPKEDDFYAFEETKELEIVIFFSQVTEDCVLAKMKSFVGDDGQMCLSYRATKETGTYEITAGRNPETLEKLESRFYLSVLNFEYIGSRRDLLDYVRRERKNLLLQAKQERSDEEKIADDKLISEIEKALESINYSVRNLVYVKQATKNLNEELQNLSFRHTGQDVIFDTGASNPSQFVDNLRLAVKTNDVPLSIGGDGRNSQVQLALWSHKNRQSEDTPDRVTLFGIEEPETHLHPHQQRKLAIYLSKILTSQVIITSHSPQIVCSFPPSSVVRLFHNSPDTLAASNGSSTLIENSFLQFGHRLNIIPAEAFFSDLVFLVEGPSDELFYKALALALDIDLDRYNISVLAVDSVGFAPYIALLKSLNIRFIIKTDNDVFKIPRQDNTWRFAGIQRGIQFYREFIKGNETKYDIFESSELDLSGFPKPIPDTNMAAAKNAIKNLEQFDIFLSQKDLESDLHNLLPNETSDFLSTSKGEATIAAMQERKASFMFNFLLEHHDKLSSLSDKPIANPLHRCKQIAETFR